MAKAMKPKFDWESQIRNKGLRATKSAVLVLKTLQHLKKPLSHDELLEYLNQSTSFDTVTLYRIMSSLNVSLATNTFSFLVAPLY